MRGIEAARSTSFAMIAEAKYAALSLPLIDLIGNGNRCAPLLITIETAIFFPYLPIDVQNSNFQHFAFRMPFSNNKNCFSIYTYIMYVCTDRSCTLFMYVHTSKQVSSPDKTLHRKIKKYNITNFNAL